MLTSLKRKIRTPFKGGSRDASAKSERRTQIRRRDKKYYQIMCKLGVGDEEMAKEMMITKSCKFSF
jgi:hypothetical protein